MTTMATYKIRITRPPPGPVSRRIRDALVGLEFWTISPSSEHISLNELCGAEEEGSANTKNHHISAYAVFMKFKGCDEKDEIAKWWVVKLSGLTYSGIIVDTDICKVLRAEKYAEI